MKNKVRYNLSGAYSKYKQLMMFFFKRKHLLEKYEFTVYDGINNCKWNGGRVNRDITDHEPATEFYYRNNINIALTFTNPIIDIDDLVGNKLLEKFHKKGNYIISRNDELQEHVKSEFPLYKHTRSITSFGKISVPMSDFDLDRYKELETRYDVIVPRCEHVFDPRFKDLDTQKYEVLVNDTCIYNCPYYEEHFNAIALQNTLYDKPWEEAGHTCMHSIEECWIPSFNPDEGHEPTRKKYGDSYGFDLSREQQQKLRDVGVNQFKIAGREMTYDDFESSLNRYFPID